MNQQIQKLEEEIKQLRWIITKTNYEIDSIKERIARNEYLMQEHTSDCKVLFECPDCGLIEEQEMQVIEENYWCNRCNFFSKLKPIELVHHLNTKKVTP